MKRCISTHGMRFMCTWVHARKCRSAAEFNKQWHCLHPASTPPAAAQPASPTPPLPSYLPWTRTHDGDLGLAGLQVVSYMAQDVMVSIKPGTTALS